MENAWDLEAYRYESESCICRSVWFWGTFLKHSEGFSFHLSIGVNNIFVQRHCRSKDNIGKICNSLSGHRVYQIIIILDIAIAMTAS